MKAVIVGCGGVGSWLAHSMVKLIGHENLILVDGDKLELKNLDRQLFHEEQIGEFKAKALGEKFGCEAFSEWYSSTFMPHEQEDWILGCVDNHPARAAVLSACDFHGCSAIIGANEVHCAEAYVYTAAWKGTKLDPRVFYPEIATDTAGDPRANAIGCTGEAQKANRQLVSANYMAAALMQHLFVACAMEGTKLSVEERTYLPHRLNANLSRLESIRARETHQWDSSPKEQ